MEHAFKHSNNDIKSCGYECWHHLINNFALDKGILFNKLKYLFFINSWRVILSEFFFNPKKLNLLLMPLINKTKSYESDSVSKSKALAWLCLIENIGNRC
jgi:hypothetical protein